MQLLTEAANQENKEAILAYTTMALLEDSEVNTEAVRRRANALLELMTPGSTVDFDSIGTLSELTSAHLLELSDTRGSLQVCPSLPRCVCLLPHLAAAALCA